MWSVIVQLAWAANLQVTGMFNSYSEKILKSWKKIKFRNRMEEKFFTKFIKSMKPLAIGVEGMMTFKSTSALIFLRAVITGTLRALLTLGLAKSGNSGDIVLNAFSGTAS